MAITGFMESSLMKSEVFTGIKDELKVVDKAINLIKNAKHIRNEDIEAAYISVKQITDTLTKEAIKAFDQERIVLIYNKEPSLAITQAVPFMTFKTKTGYTTYVFCDKYISINRDGVIKMEPSIFRDLITGALIANGLKRNYGNLSTNQYLSKILMEMYNKFFTRIINREFSVAADKILFDSIQYWVNKFFLLNIFETTDTVENVDRLASNHIKYLDETQYNDIKAKYDQANPINISGLLTLLRENSTRMKSLNISTFLNDWVNYYYAPSMLAVDNIEYLIFMTICLLSGNGAIVNISASEIVKEAKNIKSYRGELLKLI